MKLKLALSPCWFVTDLFLSAVTRKAASADVKNKRDACNPKPTLKNPLLYNMGQVKAALGGKKKQTIWSNFFSQKFCVKFPEVLHAVISH